LAKFFATNVSKYLFARERKKRYGLCAASINFRIVHLTAVLSENSTPLVRPLARNPSISPIFTADKVTITVSRENDGKLRIVYAGWDEVKLLLLGTPLTG